MLKSQVVNRYSMRPINNIQIWHTNNTKPLQKRILCTKLDIYIFCASSLSNLLA